jgi:hypothetical protein
MKTLNRHFVIAVVILLILFSDETLSADTVTDPGDYSTGDLITALSINTRFQTLYSVLDGEDIDNTNLKSDSASLEKVSGGVMMSSGSYIGIGTSSPQTDLNIIGWLQMGLDTDAYYSVLGSNALTFNRAGSASYIDQDGSGGSLVFTMDGVAALTIDNSGYVGIGTTIPGAKLNIVEDSTGLWTGVFQSAGSETRVFIGVTDRSGDANQDYSIWAEAPRAYFSDKVGIGTITPDHDLEIGSGTYSEIDAGESQFTTSSSREYKENIHSVYVGSILDKILKIPVSTYDFKKEYNDDDTKRTNKMGLIAEDFYEIFGRGSAKELNGQEVQMALWLAVQELKTENDKLIARIETLENK